MSERQKQAAFLKNLLASDDCVEHRRLEERITSAERDERCLRRACRLVVVITLAALSVLGYLTVLQVPDSMARFGKVAFHFFHVLALGSGMCLGVFAGLLFWQRGLIHRLYDEGRKLVTASLQHRAQATITPLPTVLVHEGDTAMYQIRTHATGSEVVELPKAS
jgi:hypothetical protein